MCGHVRGWHQATHMFSRQYLIPLSSASSRTACRVTTLGHVGSAGAQRRDTNGPRAPDTSLEIRPDAPLTQKYQSAAARESRSDQSPHDESAQRTCQRLSFLCSRGPHGQFMPPLTYYVSHPCVIRECRSPIAYGVSKGGQRECGKITGRNPFPLSAALPYRCSCDQPLKPFLKSRTVRLRYV